MPQNIEILRGGEGGDDTPNIIKQQKQHIVRGRGSEGMSPRDVFVLQNLVKWNSCEFWLICLQS